MKTIPALVVSFILAAVVFFALTIALTPAQISGCILTGQVTDSATGKVISGATALLTGPQGGIAGMVPTDSNGVYALAAFCPLTYSLSISATGYQNYAQTVYLAAPLAVLNVALSTGTSPGPPTSVVLKVTVLDAATGNAISAATVTFTQCSGAGLLNGCSATFTFTVTAGSDGTAPGTVATGYTWTVTANAAGYQSGSKNVIVANTPISITIKLYRSGSIDPMALVPAIVSASVFGVSFVLLRRRERRG